MPTRKGTARISCAAGAERSERLRSRDDFDPAHLLREAKGGSERAWSLLVGRYSATIKSVARSYRLSPANQDEVAQRTWLRLLENIDAVREPGAIGGWLITVARRECLRLLASSQREMPFADPLGSDVADTDVIDAALTESARREALHQALDSLPEHQRRLMRSLLVAPTLNYTELSTVLGIPRGSIGPTRGRGLARLRRDPHLRSALDGHSEPAWPARSARVIGHDLI